jgi:hypothetical protein
MQLLTYDRDDPQHKLGRALVLLCEWGREARRRQATAGDAATMTDDTAPMEGAPDSQEATTLIESAGS